MDSRAILWIHWENLLPNIFQWHLYEFFFLGHPRVLMVWWMMFKLNNCATEALGCHRKKIKFSKKIPWKDFGSKIFSIYPLNVPRIFFRSTVFWLSFLIIWGTSFDHSWHFRFISAQLRLTVYQVTTFEVPTEDEEKNQDQ